MFTGLIEEIGKIHRIKRLSSGAELMIETVSIASDAAVGESIAVNGICLTATSVENRNITFGISSETLARSTSGSWKPGEPVNLERALSASGRFGGHIVQGHTDCTGLVHKVLSDGGFYTVIIEYPAEIENYIVEKGSISIDGISLTIAELNAGRFSIAVIPETYKSTIIQHYKPGRKVNIEVDILAKYVEKMLKDKNGTSEGVTSEMLNKYGY